MASGQKKTFKKEDLIEAIYKSGGIVSHLCETLGYSRSQRTNVYRLLDKYEIRDELERAREVTLDLAESQLFKLIHKGNLGAICFYLKTIGKRRGYIENHHHVIDTANNITEQDKVDVANMTHEEKLAYLASNENKRAPH